MEERYIKDCKVSLLGMGCMRLPRKETANEIDIKTTEKMIDLALQSGITYFDTAYPYHEGKSEIVIGNILKKYPRKSFYLADKLPIWNCKSLQDVQSIFEEQLRKCQVDYFDFYLCHAMNLERLKLYKEFNVFPYLLDLKKQGKILHLCFSFHDAAQNIEVILKELPWDFAQIQLNYLDYDMQDAKQQYELITKYGASVVVMEPVRGGMLAEVCEPATHLFKEERPQASIASWALRYVANFPNVKVILSGMSSLEQLQDNINTFTSYEPLSKKEENIILEAKKHILGNEFIACTGCKYCMPCPFGVDIPRIFRTFNLYGIHHDLLLFKKDIETLGTIDCKACGKCMKECPQKLQIPILIEKIKKRVQ